MRLRVLALIIGVLSVCAQCPRQSLAEDPYLLPTVASEEPTRLPPVIPATTSSQPSEVSRLEARIAQLESRLAEKPTGPEAPKTPEPYVVGSDLDLTAKWHHGLELQSKHKDFRVHVGGRMQVDTSWFTGTDNVENTIDNGGVGPLRDATNFRRGRFRIDGTMYQTIDWATEFDFINETRDLGNATNPQSDIQAIPAPTDVWVTVKEIPCLGNFRIGNMKDPYGFEHLTSSRWLNFMERSFNQDAFQGAFNNGFLPGVMFFDTWLDDDRGTWWIGEFKNVNNIFDNGVGDGEMMTVGRITWLPWYQDEGRCLLHVGVAGRHMGLDEGRVRFRSRGDIRSGAPGPSNPVFANTGFIAGDYENQIGVELASVIGPWTVQAEYFASFVADASTLANGTNAGQQPAPGAALGTVFYQGTYVEVLYFLTGEHRAYNKKNAVFDRVIPNSNFFLANHSHCGCCGGWGAWQVGARYNFLDLNDSGLNGGILHAFTAGLNWFWNPNMKLQFNYDLTDRSFVNTLGNDGSGYIHGYGCRFAWDF